MEKLSMNDWADYWRYDVGVNVIPADTQNKRPIVEWRKYQNVPISEEHHNEWKSTNAFAKGIAILPGKVWHNQFKKGLYLVFVDLDNKKAIDEFCTRDGITTPLTELAKGMIIEQHKDDPNKAHAYFYSKHPFIKKSSDRVSDLSLKIDRNEIPAIEVKGLGEHGIAYCTPSVHKNGHCYEIIGSTEATEISDLDQHIDSICKKYNIPYLDGNVNCRALTPIHDLFNEDTKIYEGHNRHEALLRVMESLLLRNYGILVEAQIKPLAADWNQQHCVPPLENREFNKQWKDAVNFIKDKVKADEATTEPSQKQTELQELIQIKVTDQDIHFVLETMYKEAPYDKVPIKQLFCGMCSAFTKTGMPHNVNSPMAGAGKNYLLSLVASKFPDKYVEQLVGASDKAFLHRRGMAVVKDEETGEIQLLDPLIDALEQQIGTLGERIDEEKSKTPSDKVAIKKYVGEIKEKQNEIKRLLKRQQKLIDLNDLIIIISDTPQEGFFTNLMSLMSQDSTRDQEYLFTDKTPAGRAESTANIIRGMPVIFSTQVIDDTDNKRFAEKNRRSILITPNTDDEKITAALDLIGKQAALLPEEYDEKVVSREAQERAKKIVAIIVEKLRHHSKHLKPRESGVKVPFHSAIAHSIPGEGVWRMTAMKRIMGYLSIITKIHMDNRPRLVNVETGAFYPISTFEDLVETLELMEAGGSNIRAYLAKCYNEVILPTFRGLGGKVKEIRIEGGDVVAEKENRLGLTTEEIGQAIHEKLGIPTPGTKQIRDTYLYPLLNHGLLNSVRSVINRSENLWFPVDDRTNAFSIFRDSNRKLWVSDSKVYPSQNVIEEEYSSIVKQDAERGTQNKKIFYRLEDANGSEISVSELGQKYFLHPESCFIKESEVIINE